MRGDERQDRGHVPVKKTVCCSALIRAPDHPLAHGPLSFPVSGPEKPLGEATADFRFAAAVACWGMLLRDSEHKGQGDFDRVLALARSARGDDASGYRAEFIRLVETAKELGGR